MSFYDFLGKYWREILQCVEVLVGFICFLLFILNKKRKISSSLVAEAFNYIYRSLPVLISSVEQLGDYSGFEKKQIVLKTALQLLSKFFGRTLNVDETALYSLEISTAIEEILGTPQKKEILNEEKK